MDISFIVIKDIVINWINQWIGKDFFRKSRLRYNYKQRLKEIIDDFAPAMKYTTINGSLFSIISLPDITDANKNIELNNLKKVTLLLGNWYSQERVRIEFEYQSKSFIDHGHDATQCDIIVC